MRSLSDHLGKRGSPDLNSAWNWNLKRLNWTSAYAIINSGRLWARYSGFQGEKSNLPYFSMPRGLATSVSFPEVQNRKETESGLALWRPRMAHPDQRNCSDASPRMWPNLFHPCSTLFQPLPVRAILTKKEAEKNIDCHEKKQLRKSTPHAFEISQSEITWIMKILRSCLMAVW